MDDHEGLVLAVRPYRDASKLVKILTPEGLVTCLVRSSRPLASKNYAYTHELARIRYSVVRRGLNRFPLLTSGVLVSDFPKTKGDPEKLEQALHVMELALTFAETVDDARLFHEFTTEILARIEEGSSRYYSVIYALKLTYLLGIAPVFRACVSCGKTTNLVGFSIASGGMKCADCASVSDSFVDPDVTAILSALYALKMKDLSEEVLARLPADTSAFHEALASYYDRFLSFTSKVSASYAKSAS